MSVTQNSTSNIIHRKELLKGQPLLWGQYRESWTLSWRSVVESGMKGKNKLSSSCDNGLGDHKMRAYSRAELLREHIHFTPNSHLMILAQSCYIYQ